jgi:hypothetical protein
MEKNEIGGECNEYVRGERRVQGFGGVTRGKKPLGRPRRRWEGSIKMDIQEDGCGVGSG